MPEVLKIILAVLGIVALLYLAFSMYGLFTKKAKLEQARGTLDEITAKIDSLKDGESGKVIVLSPKDWTLVSFAANAPKPKFCLSDCICICDGTDVEDCQSAGLCRSLTGKSFSGKKIGRAHV